jgi:hypothetical protein
VDYLRDNLSGPTVMAERHGFQPKERSAESLLDTKAFYLCSTLSARDIEVAERWAWPSSINY